MQSYTDVYEIRGPTAVSTDAPVVVPTGAPLSVPTDVLIAVPTDAPVADPSREFRCGASILWMALLMFLFTGGVIC